MRGIKRFLLMESTNGNFILRTLRSASQFFRYGQIDPPSICAASATLGTELLI
jgi:hypothetical protein